jgi:hypothetical protein
MCTAVFICHGDRTSFPYDSPVPVQAVAPDCKPAMYYITNDGKYAVDADYVSAEDILSGKADLSTVPKIAIEMR